MLKTVHDESQNDSSLVLKSSQTRTQPGTPIKHTSEKPKHQQVHAPELKENLLGVIYSASRAHLFFFVQSHSPATAFSCRREGEVRRREDPRTGTVAAGRRGGKLEKHTRYTAVWGQFMFTDHESKPINRT